MVILPAQFSRRNFPTRSKVKICEDTKSMREKLMDQAEEKYRVSSEWVEPTSVASRRQFTRNLCILVPQVTQLQQKRVRKTAVLCHAILANSLARFTSLPTLQRLTDQWTDHEVIPAASSSPLAFFLPYISLKWSLRP